ncbi:uncharacterized protein L201_000537 [Kwoniella dendrophila CBS 6074]|uniref:Carbohydrate kinase PfkB domain-containing protein n=1 Tax=Kwoniella dendrophila CBS 6074 TaxID=1295534 RepID=A0AAX4JL10_9TREE
MVDFNPPTREFLDSKGRVVTLGMFIIDHHAAKDENGNEHMTEEESIGGGGVFAMISARMFLPSTHCGLLVDRGDDFPDSFTETLTNFGEDMVWYRPREGKTTRALNIYSGNKIGEGHQSFKYLSPQLNLLPHDFILPPSPFSKPNLPEWIHVVCNTERARLIVNEMQEIKSNGVQNIGKGWNGNLVWEPMPSCCKPSELQNILDLAPSFSVISPNLLELQSILNISPNENPSKEEAEIAVQSFHQLLLDQNDKNDSSIPTIVVRCGELGSYTFSLDWKGWIPPYHGLEDQDKVKDVTGGGNSFLGGLCAGLLITQGDMKLASIYAATAASFTIEQRGLPNLTYTEKGERWNNEDPWTRLRELEAKVNKMELFY